MKKPPTNPPTKKKNPNNFVQARLRNHNFDGVHLTAYDFTGADLRGANLSDGVYRHCLFAQADLMGACVAGAQFESCDFTDTNWDGVVLTGARFRHCSFAGEAMLRAGFTHDMLLVGNDFACPKGDRLNVDDPPLLVRSRWGSFAIVAGRAVILHTEGGLRLADSGETETVRAILKDIYNRALPKNL